MFQYIMLAMPLLQQIENGVTNPAERQKIEKALANVLHGIAALTPPTTILGKACAAALEVLSTAEAVAGDSVTP